MTGIQSVVSTARTLRRLSWFVAVTGAVVLMSNRAAALEAARPPEAAKVMAARHWRDVLSAEDHRWHVHWDSLTGCARMLYGGASAPAAGAPAQIARAFLAHHGAIFGLARPDTQLRLLREVETPMGRNVSFQQVHAGIVVYNAFIDVVIDREGRAVHATSTFAPELELEVAPMLQPASAAQALERSVDGVTLRTAPELVVYPRPTPRLAYLILCSVDPSAVPWEYLIDANTSEVLRRTRLILEQGASRGAASPRSAGADQSNVVSNDLSSPDALEIVGGEALLPQALGGGQLPPNEVPGWLKHETEPVLFHTLQTLQAQEVQALGGGQASPDDGPQQPTDDAVYDYDNAPRSLGGGRLPLEEIPEEQSGEQAGWPIQAQAPRAFGGGQLPPGERPFIDTDLVVPGTCGEGAPYVSEDGYVPLGQAPAFFKETDSLLAEGDGGRSGECLTSGGCSNFHANYPSGTLSTTSSSWTVVSEYVYGGDYAYYSVTAGQTYEWSLCSSDGASCGYDGQLTLWNQGGTTRYCYSDDYCGDDAKIAWTASLTGTVRVLVSQYNCQTNSTDTTLLWRCASCTTCLATIYDAWWSDEVDNDGDGCVYQARLNWDPDTNPCSCGPLTVFEKIYYKTQTGSWQLLYTTSSHSVEPQCPSSDSYYITVTGAGACTVYDWKIEIYRSGQPSPDYTRDFNNDGSLNDYDMEGYEPPPTATIADAWWSSQVDVDGDGCKRSARLNWNPDVSGCSGTLTVFEKLYWKDWWNPFWTEVDTTSPHTITNCSSSDSQYLDYWFSTGCAEFDWKIEIYRSGESSADYARDPGNDGDLDNHDEERAEDDVIPTATIADAWWSNEVDTDADGCKRSARLNWNPDVSGCNGTLTVFEKIYWKPAASGTWALLTTTSTYAITDCSSTDSRYQDYYFLNTGCAEFDWKIEIYRNGEASPDYARDPGSDGDLNNHDEERPEDDVILTATIADAWWSNQVDLDGDGCTRSARLNWNADVSGCSGTLMVFEKIYRKDWWNPFWTEVDTTSDHPITNCSSSDAQYRDYWFLNAGCAEFDWKIEVYRSGQSSADDARDPGNDGDLDNHDEERAEDDVIPTATIADAWWSNEVDTDADGCKRSARLNWNPDVSGCNGTLMVFEKIYWKPAASGTWALLTTTSTYAITDCSSTDSRYQDYNFLNTGCAEFDWKIEIYRNGEASPDYTRDPGSDGDLNNHDEERPEDDVIVTATIADAWWSNQVDLDGDGCTRSARLNWNADVSGCSGTLSVFEKIYWKEWWNPFWTQVDITPEHPITNCSSSDAQHLDYWFSTGCAAFDWKIEIYRTGESSADYARDPGNDGDLDDHREETSDDDEPPVTHIFDPNPVNTLDDDTLRDGDDADTAVPAGAYVDVTLTRLDPPSGGQHYLRGDFAFAEDIQPPNGSPPSSDTDIFHYTRQADEFEWVMCYYHVTVSQEYIQSLGFSAVNNRAIRFDAHAENGDRNAHYTADPIGDGYLTFGGDSGTGVVDLAEDSDVILHEYGHSIQDNQNPGRYFDDGDVGYGNETRAMGEGFGDYWAASSTYAQSAAHGYDPAICAEWAWVPGGLRRVDRTKHYPEDMVDEVHDDGEIWSACLWNIFGAIGKQPADRIIIQSHFLVPADPTFADGAEAILAADADEEFYDGAHFAQLRMAFVNRGILDPVPSPRITSITMNGSSAGEVTVILGASVDVSIVAENNSDGASPEAMIQASFPELDAQADRDQVSQGSPWDGDLAYHEYYPGGPELIWYHCDDPPHQAPAQYLLVTGDDPDWQTQESNSATFRFTPVASGTYHVYIKAAMADNASPEWFLDPTSGPEDQQCENVYVRTINVQQTHVLSVSANPEVHASIDVTPDPDGTTPFNRNYTHGTTVSLYAPEYSGSYRFLRWRMDGDDQPLAQPTLSVTMDNDHDAVAIYTHTYWLTVASDPEIGAYIDTTPGPSSDTPFERRYDAGTSVALTAPGSSGSYIFERWRLDGSDQPAGQRAISLVMDQGRAAVAVFNPPAQYHELSVAAQPELHVSIDVSPDPDGATPFVRTYDEDSNIVLTAPPTWDGYQFERWRLDGVGQAPGQRILSATMDVPHSTLALYTQAPISVALTLDGDWTYANVPDQASCSLMAAATIVSDPLGNSSYTYVWEFLLPTDVTVVPTTQSGGELSDTTWEFAAPGCDMNGVSDSGMPHRVRVTVTGDQYGNSGTAEVEFGIALLGDVNNDGIVNVADRAIVNAFWRDGHAGSFTLQDCDVNCDGIVNVADRSIVNAIWRGVLCDNQVSVPCALR